MAPRWGSWGCWGFLLGVPLICFFDMYAPLDCVVVVFWGMFIYFFGFFVTFDLACRLIGRLYFIYILNHYL